MEWIGDSVATENLRKYFAAVKVNDEEVSVPLCTPQCGDIVFIAGHVVVLNIARQSLPPSVLLLFLPKRLFSAVFVCLLARLHKTNVANFFYKIWWKGDTWTMEETIRF